MNGWRTGSDAFKWFCFLWLISADSSLHSFRMFTARNHKWTAAAVITSTCGLWILILIQRTFSTDLVKIPVFQSKVFSLGRRGFSVCFSSLVKYQSFVQIRNRNKVNEHFGSESILFTKFEFNFGFHHSHGPFGSVSAANWWSQSELLLASCFLINVFFSLFLFRLEKRFVFLVSLCRSHLGVELLHAKWIL